VSEAARARRAVMDEYSQVPSKATQTALKRLGKRLGG
jgi:hypothetical protein